ncbi:MAG: NADH-quinone oxidoreductase subunit A [Planctomycetota bacterium]
MQAQDYLPILVLLLVVVGFVVVNLVISELLGHKRRTRGKGRTYECGMRPVGTARGRFSVKFFLVAVLFILFDIESVFLIPWAVNLRDLAADGHGAFLLIEMLAFLGILGLGLAYIWRKGGLEWD